MLKTTTTTDTTSKEAKSEILHTLKILVHNYMFEAANRRAESQFLKGKAKRDAMTEFYLGGISTLDFLFSEINDKGSLILPSPMFEIMRGEYLQPIENHPDVLLINANLEQIFTIVKPSKI